MQKDPRLGKNSFGFLIQVLARRIEKSLKQRLEEFPMDIRTFANLMELAMGDGLNQKEIGERLNFPEYQTSRSVDMLVQLGWAERRPDPESRRSVHVFLTNEGREIAARLPALIEKNNAEFSESLDASEQRELIRLLKKVWDFKG